MALVVDGLVASDDGRGLFGEVHLSELDHQLDVDIVGLAVILADIVAVAHEGHAEEHRALLLGHCFGRFQTFGTARSVTGHAEQFTVRTRDAVEQHIVEHLVFALGHGRGRELRSGFFQHFLEVLVDMLVADLQVPGVLGAQFRGRAFRRRAAEQSVSVGLFPDALVINTDIRSADHGVFEHGAFRHPAVELRTGFFELFQFFFVVVLRAPEVVLALVIFRNGDLGHLRLVDIPPKTPFERYDLVSHRFEPLHDGTVAVTRDGQVQACIFK